MSPKSLLVAPDGSGDFRTLAEAIASTLPGTLIRLIDGIYSLASPLLVDKTLTLQGAGPDHSRLVCDGEAYVVRFVGPGAFTLKDLSFEHKGEQWADVVDIETGEVSLHHCRFTGGIKNEAIPRSGSGLRLRGQSHGVVTDCEFMKNDLTGISVEDQSQPTLERNICRENYIGIGYSDSAAGVARQNNCVANKYHGITVEQQAQPTLAENDCQSNNGIGILYADTASGTATQNNCNSNKFGIGVSGQAQPMLDQNTCQDNGYAGIYYSSFHLTSYYISLCFSSECTQKASKTSAKSFEIDYIPTRPLVRPNKTDAPGVNSVSIREIRQNQS